MIANVYFSILVLTVGVVVATSVWLFGGIWRESEIDFRKAIRNRVRKYSPEQLIASDLSIRGTLYAFGRTLRSLISSRNAVLFYGCVAGLMGVAIKLATESMLTRLGLLAGCAAIVVAVPWLLVRARQAQRRDRLRKQLPEALELMKRSLRAGQSLTTAFCNVAQEMSSPIAEEFSRCAEKQNLGATFHDSLRQVSSDVRIVELKIFSAAMILNQKFGGNVAEVFGNLAVSMRKRATFHARLRALTSEGRMQAIVLTTMPLVALAIIRLIEPQYAQVLIDHPRLLLLMFTLQLIGTYFIRRIVTFKF